MLVFEYYSMILLILFYYVYDLVLMYLVEGWKVEVFKGGFEWYFREKCEKFEKFEYVEGEEDMGDGVDEEVEEDCEGVDVSLLLLCFIEGCICIY